MIDLKGRFSVSDEKIDSIIKDEVHHPFYNEALRRSRVMNSWHAAEFDEFVTTAGTIFSDKSYIIKQSSIESNEEYNKKLLRMRLFPLEAKFLSAQQRIYDENNVNRMYPDNSDEFWKWKEGNFDDQGASITEFYRDKVMYVKETLGFGAIVTDIMMDDQGNRILDPDNNVVPYNYIIRPHELWNFEVKQGQLILLVTRQQKHTADKSKKEYEWRVFTPNKIQVYDEKNGTRNLRKEIANPFGEVPATILRGAVDASSSFMIGKPRRYDLKGLYKAASELFYDLQKGSELFAHPIPAYPESIAKSLSGVTDDDEYDATTIKEKLGMVVIYPDDMELPNQLFYQADMGGLQHLRDVIFKDLMSLIFLLAKVRDKSVQKSNVSGSAKQFDNVEEQGLLAQTAMDMQDIEQEVLHRMARVRDEDWESFGVNYSKHYDLSSADELWQDYTEGQQYGGVPFQVEKYQLIEYLRKRSAPQEAVDALEKELEILGKPAADADLQTISDVLGNVVAKAKARPELLSDPAISDLEQLKSRLEENDQATDQGGDQEGIDSQDEQE